MSDTVMPYTGGGATTAQTVLTLDAPGAREAMGRVYRMLRRWANEADRREGTQTADAGDPGRDVMLATASDDRERSQGATR